MRLRWRGPKLTASGPSGSELLNTMRQSVQIVCSLIVKGRSIFHSGDFVGALFHTVHQLQVSHRDAVSSIASQDSTAYAGGHSSGAPGS